MSRVTSAQLLLAGSHFGHLARRWNPKMREFIFAKKKGIHLIDLNKTVERLDRACEEVMKIVAKRGKVLFVGTKAQAKELLREEANRCGMYYVTERWLGGLLTNFQTIRKSVKTLEALEKKSVDGTYEKISKKEILMVEREKAKLLKVLEGIRNMKVLPNAIFVVDTVKEAIAVKEAKKLGIPVFAIVDTNSNPEEIDFPIPANDDAFKSIGLVTKVFSDAVLEACQVANIKAADEAVAAEDKGEDKPKRRVAKRPLKKNEEKSEEN